MRTFLPFITPLFLLGVLASCGPSDSSGSASVDGPPPLPEDVDPLSKKLEAFTGGPTKGVWARYTGQGSDVFGNYDKLQLWGIDTRDGRGVRPILKELANYARPLILPDGSGIVFSQKGTINEESGRKRFNPTMKRVDWEGREVADLGRGFAVDVWRDPETGLDWVYATDLAPTNRSSMEGTVLERFPLDEPGRKREKVWDQTRITTENIQLSRDGNRASCLFPWPDAGVLNLERMTHRKYQHGCWPSMAPDDSYHAWVFDGAHKNLFLFTDDAEKTWTVAVNTAPGIGKHEMYHPRWSNHVRYFAITGPYTGDTPSRSDTDRVEVLIGRFSPDLKKVEEWLQITDDRAADQFPDLWIAGGEMADLGREERRPPPQGPAAKDRGWPASGGSALFVWENRDAPNTTEGGGRACAVQARGRARFGPRFEMLADGGHFEMDAASEAAVLAQLDGQTRPFTVELLARPLNGGQKGLVFESPGLSIEQRKDHWIFRSGTTEIAAPLDPAGTAHLAVVSGDQDFLAYLNGKPMAGNALAASSPFVAPGGTAFGRDWSGTIEGVAISSAAASPEAIAASHAHWKKILAGRPPIPTVRLRGKLVEMTANRPVEALDTYQRALLGYLYEVEEVLEGGFPAKRVAVLHWTILDRQPLPGYPRELGKSYELTLQPAAAHPELVSERQWSDLLDPAEPYFDIATP